MRTEILAVVLIALVVIGATYTGDSGTDADEAAGDQTHEILDRPGIIYKAVKEQGVAVEEVHLTNGSEIKKAFDLEDSGIEDNSSVAFIMFRYSAAEGADLKAEMALTTIYVALSIEPSIDGVMVMPYDPTDKTVRTTMVYTNRSHAVEVAQQNLTLRRFYNSFDVYAISGGAA